MFMTKQLILAVAMLLAIAQSTLAQYQNWRHSGSLYILTTPEGADLPEAISEENFPLLIRLSKDWFDFSQAKPAGADIRFATASGKPLSFQIEHWDAAAGSASVWVLIPSIKGNARQEIQIYWGNADAASESNGRAVFNESNGYLSVWHMNDSATDAVGTLKSTDTGTTMTTGVIGGARTFPGGKGIYCGDQIDGYPVGSAPHTTEAWFRPRQPNSIVIGWGKEYAQGKIIMGYRSPPHAQIDAYFSDGNVTGKTRIPTGEWVHVVHTYQKGDSRLYVDGKLDSARQSRATPLSIKSPARLWIGGWYNNYSFVGDIDETRVSKVVRSSDWVRLQYENQKPLQTLVGPVVPQGKAFAVTPAKAKLAEGKSVVFSAQAGGAQKIYWSVIRDGHETLAAVDRLGFVFDAGRVTSDTPATLRFKAVYPDAVKTVDIPVAIAESIPEPEFTLRAPAKWDGRKTIHVVAEISNRNELAAKGVDKLKYNWSVSGLAAIKEIAPRELLLLRAQNSGDMTVTLTLSNGGYSVTSSIAINVQEPAKDAWVSRTPDKNERPVDGQFFARDDQNQGTLNYNGNLSKKADSVFLDVYANDKLYKRESQKLPKDNSYAFSVKLKPGLINYRVEFGAKSGKTETVIHKVSDLVCGDAYLIDGQSNALATDTREDSPRETNEWIRSYAHPRYYREDEVQNLWCRPVWKAQREHKAELGWWGMELAKRLVARQQVPIFIINGSAGGTRIDQHQRNVEKPADLNTIYGRMLWRAREARLTHGIRGIFWHQGENDQGAAGPDGGYGWETYQRYFVEMSAAWKQDFPNVQHYYVYQIFPNACSMGNGNGDMLREVQRTLPRLYSNMDVISTLGVEPPGGCHYPLKGWAKFASLVQPLIERDFYGRAVTGAITSPNLKRAYFTSDAKNEIALEFDQAVIWNDSLINEFYLDGAKEQVASGASTGNVVTLKLTEASSAQKITYLKEMSWSQKRLLKGKNGLAALTFCDVPIFPKGPLD